MTRARILLADDHRIVAEGLKGILSAEFELAGVVEDGQAMIDAARALRPDAIVADITMPLLNGIEALESLRSDGLEIPVIFLTMHRDVDYASLALEAGAAGYVLKHAAPAELVSAVRIALEGGTFISPSIAGELFQAKNRGQAKSAPGAALSERQRDILRLLADGRSAKEIAKALEISPRTVEFHKYKVMESLGLKNSAELIQFAIKQGIV
ncbi:MAG: response regulator transcription factor [Burkholderiales bacterium]|nr:response regulator transcription factor [Burkholderiales bacterium]